MHAAPSPKAEFVLVQSQGVFSLANMARSRLTIHQCLGAKGVLASTGRTTSHASLGPSFTSSPGAAWKVTVVT